MNINDLPDASPSVLDALPPSILMQLHVEAAERMKEASKLVAIVHDVLANRYAKGVNKFGATRITDGGVEIHVTIPKKVKWEQALLKDAVEVIAKTWNENPEDYVDIEVKVSETRYGAWPPAIAALFEDARTVEAGKPTFKLSLAKKEAA